MIYLSLMAFSFLAATIIPVSSEAALATALAFGVEPVNALLFATAGNCMGVAFNYWLGFVTQKTFLEKHRQKKSVARAYSITQKWGKWSLLLSWLPVIGDPITILAGVLEIRFGFFTAITFPLRFIRYLFILGIFSNLNS